LQSLLAQEIDEISIAPCDPDTGAPAHFASPTEEYRAGRCKAAVRDASHLSRLRFDGEDHLDFLHRMTTNHCLELQPGTGIEVIFPDNRGRIVEFGCCHHLADATSLFIGGPADGQQLLSWLERYHFSERMQIRDEAASSAMIELIGPESADIARSLGIDITQVPEHSQLQNEGSDYDALFLRLDRFSCPGLRAVGDISSIARLWQALRAAGCDPIGEEAFETLRIEFGVPASRRELTQEFNPWEPGLARAVHMNKGCYIGQEVIARLDTYDKVKQHLVGLAFDGELMPQAGDVISIAEREVGTVTSATSSPLLGHPIALGYVRTSHCAVGTIVSVGSAAGNATVVDLPFAPHR